MFILCGGTVADFIRVGNVVWPLAGSSDFDLKGFRNGDERSEMSAVAGW
jgi:hypothetical protein